MELLPAYVCYNPLEAQNARTILASEGIEPATHDLRSSAFPVHDDSNARITLEVFAKDLPRAREVLKAAQERGELQGEGTVA